jgi:hypothetical protein
LSTPATPPCAVVEGFALGVFAESAALIFGRVPPRPALLFAIGTSLAGGLFGYLVGGGDCQTNETDET